MSLGRPSGLGGEGVGKNARPFFNTEGFVKRNCCKKKTTIQGTQLIVANFDLSLRVFAKFSMSLGRPSGLGGEGVGKNIGLFLTRKGL